MKTGKEIGAEMEDAWQEYISANKKEPEFKELWYQEYKKDMSKLVVELDRIIEMEKER